jgi:hypothetical protein
MSIRAVSLKLDVDSKKDLLNWEKSNSKSIVEVKIKSKF